MDIKHPKEHVYQLCINQGEQKTICDSLERRAQVIHGDNPNSHYRRLGALITTPVTTLKHTQTFETVQETVLMAATCSKTDLASRAQALFTDFQTFQKKENPLPPLTPLERN